MDYAAVISLRQTINGLVRTSRFSHVSLTLNILNLASKWTNALQQVYERLNDSSRSRSRSSRKRLDALEGQIRDCAHELEDVLEFHELNSLEKKYEEAEVKQGVASFVEKVKKLKKDYIEELSRPDTEDDDDDDDDDDDAVVSSNIDSGVEMVGQFNLFAYTRQQLLSKTRPDDMWVSSFLGEIGSGRTATAKTIYENLRRDSVQYFDCYAWVTFRTKHEFKQVLIRILAQVDKLAAPEYEWLISREDEKLCEYLYKILQHRRYMIVFDDVRDVEVVDYLRRSLPNQSNGSFVILTTNLKEVALMADSSFDFDGVDSRYFQERNWISMRPLIFGFEYISPELDEAGRKIIENCRGRFVSAAKTLLFLLKSEKTVEQWSKIATDKEHPIFMVADEISEISRIKTEIQFYNWDMDEERRKRSIEWISTCLDHDEFSKNVKRLMHPERFFSKMQIISLFGMIGIGKSFVARKFFEDKSFLWCYDHHVWVTLGPKYQTEDILIDILAQVYPNIDKLHMKGNGKLTRDLCAQLSSKRCLVVLDDVWSKEPLHHLKNLFPDIKGTTLVTTRLAEVAKFGEHDMDFQMELLDKEESWCLLRQKVFGGGQCSTELEKAGRKIAENCDGLPLLILTVAGQLLKLEMSEENWNDVASGKQKSVFMNAHLQISKALLPSYHRLPQHRKACFLYIGVFRQKYEIKTSELANLWTAEGFMKTRWPQMEEDYYVTECLTDLVRNSLVIVQRKVSDLQIKTCRLHSVFWHLANSLAAKHKFFHAMNSYDDDDCSMESIKSQRRLCIRNSILLGMKDVQNSMASNTSAHSVLCVGPLQQYPVPLNFDLRLLRVMNALTIRLYEFPVEVVRLTHLKYLGLTCNGKLPTSISKLWKLQYLIVKRYMNVKSSENSLLLPVEIWDMRELKHLEVMGGILPDSKFGNGLYYLSTLLDVSAQCCRPEVFGWIPNLKRLGIRIELKPGDEVNSIRCLENIYVRYGLESLKCVVVNPQIKYEVVPPPPAPISMFPASLKKLSLSGLGYPWEYMSIIGSLQNLEVLKLKHYAFQGPKWDVDFYDQFPKLKFLLVEDTDLVHWKFNLLNNNKLDCLCIKHCYKLQELPIASHMDRLRKLEIVDCNPLTLNWAEQVSQRLNGGEVKVHLSWIAGTPRE